MIRFTRRLAPAAFVIVGMLGAGYATVAASDGQEGAGVIGFKGYQEKFIDVNGTRTRYLEAGAGEPLVLVHGNDFGSGVSANLWDRNLAGLSKNFHVYAFDKLGAGFTDNPKNDEYTIEAVVRHAYAFVKAVGLTRFHLVGQSRGAYLVARLTLEHPEMVQTLIMCDSNTLAPAVGRPERREDLLGNDIKDVREAQRFRWTQLSYTTGHITDEALDLSVKIQSMPKTKEAQAALKRLGDPFVKSLEKQKPDTLRRIQAGEIKVPTLVYWGYNDKSAILEGGLKLFDLVAANNPNARMFIINRAGHFHFREYPDEFNATITDFIRLHKVAS